MTTPSPDALLPWPRVNGIARDADTSPYGQRCLVLHLERKPTNEEMSAIHDALNHRWNTRAPRSQEAATASGWQPMESAPVDGTEILAAIHVHDTRGNPTHWDRHVIAFDGDELNEVRNDLDLGWRFHDYNFWQPLPEPPQ